MNKSQNQIETVTQEVDIEPAVNQSVYDTNRENVEWDQEYAQPLSTQGGKEGFRLGTAHALIYHKHLSGAKFPMN